MIIEFEKIDRYSFPSGMLDFAVKLDGQRMYAACMDGIYELPLADASTEKAKPHRIGRHGSYVSSVALIESTNKLLTTSYVGTFQVRDLAKTVDDSTGGNEELAPQISERIHRFWSWDMALSPDHRFIASVSGQYLVGAEDYAPLTASEPTVNIIDATTGRQLHGFDMLPSVQCVAIDPSSRYVAAGNLMGDLAVWEVESGRQLAGWRTKSFTSWGITKSHCYISGAFAISFSPDSQSLYAAGMGDMRDPMAGNGRQLWQRFDWRRVPVEMKQETITTQSGEGLMETLAWHPSGAHFVMAGRLRGGKWNLGVFDTETGQLIGEAKTAESPSTINNSVAAPLGWNWQSSSLVGSTQNIGGLH